MKIRLFIVAVLCVFPLTLGAQTNEEFKKAILEFHECFFNKASNPIPHEESFELSSGKVVTTLLQTDFERSVFVSADNLLQEVRTWKESPYMWQMLHRKENKALMDRQDLSSWETGAFEKISQKYFEGSNSTFHIAAHGLLGDSAEDNSILMGGQRLTASETAELIIHSMKDEFHSIINAEEQPFVVVVHSCNTASGEDSFASQLSKELSKFIPGASVVGAPDVVWCTFDSNGEYQEYVSSFEQARWYKPETQNWKVYRNGSDTGEGLANYKDTVAAIQNNLKK